MENLKSILLGLGVFEDNEYLDLYCSLIESNKGAEKEKFITQAHHFIPVACYKYIDRLDDTLDARTRRRRCLEDQENFVVNLKFIDHVLAHYYLSMACLSTTPLKTSMTRALQRMGVAHYLVEIAAGDLATLAELQTNYQQLLREAGAKHSEKMKGNMPTP